MLKAPQLFCAPFIWFNKLFFLHVYSFLFPQYYPIIYATAIFLISVLAASTTDSPYCWQCHIFFMIQLIIFDFVPGQFLFVFGWQKAAGEADFGRCQLWLLSHQIQSGERPEKVAQALFLWFFIASAGLSLCSTPLDIQNAAFFIRR